MMINHRKTYKLRTCVSWFILICFLAGQYMVFSHHHVSSQKLAVSPSKHALTTRIVSEKCNLCDMMHHMHMEILEDSVPFVLSVICNIQYTRQHDYKGIALILSAGRSPPSKIV